MPVKQSVCYPMLNSPDINLDALFEAAARIGYEAVEMWGRGDTFAEELALARKHGLRMVSMIGHASLPDGLNKRSNHDRIEQEIKVAIDIAVEHSIPGHAFGPKHALRNRG